MREIGRIAMLIHKYPLLICTLVITCACSVNQIHTSSAAPSWIEQQKILYQKVAEVNSQAVIATIIARAEPLDHNDSTMHLSVRARFVSNSDQTIDLTYTDTSITDTLHIDRVQEADGSFSQHDAEYATSVLNQVHISPAEAINIVRPEAEAFATEHHITFQPSAVLYTQEKWKARFGVPAVWGVVVLGANNSINFYIDASTGKILEVRKE